MPCCAACQAASHPARPPPITVNIGLDFGTIIIVPRKSSIIIVQLSELGLENNMQLGTTELVIILVIVILLFGVGRITKVGKELGSGIRAFREGIRTDA